MKDVENTNVLDLLDYIIDIVDNGTTVPLSAKKVVVDKDEIIENIQLIKENLPEDIIQAQWVREQKAKIIAEAREEYKTVLVVAKEEADRLVEEHVITKNAKENALKIYQEADEYSKSMRLKTVAYMTEILEGFRDNVNGIYEDQIKKMYDILNDGYNYINGTVSNNLDQLEDMIESIHNEIPTDHNVDINASYSNNDNEE